MEYTTTHGIFHLLHNIYTMNLSELSPAPYTSEYIKEAPQIERHQIAKMQQYIYDSENHVKNLQQHLMYIGQTINTKEKSQEYAEKLLILNKTIEELNMHREALSKMIEIADINFGKTIAEQARREIYHFYHAGRYKQADLAKQYCVSQSAISKIVNGEAPGPTKGVNPNGVAKS
jgi:hypothetical protein